MSLINEALKRAKEAEGQGNAAPAKQKSAPQKISEPAMKPVEAKQNSNPIVYILSAALVLVLVCAMVLLWFWNGSREQKGQRTVATEIPKIETTSAPQTTPVAISQPAKQTQPAPVAATSAPVPAKPEITQLEAETAPAAETKPAEQTAAPVVAAETPAAPVVPQFPTLKLQGIFYNPVKPSVVLNGKSYSVGGVVAGARVVSIEPEKVTVEWNGETRVLETAQ